MERSSRRGKIPQKDWPSIIARHAAGETLASIARTYDCSAPAISYIVSRTHARERAAVSAEPDGTAPAREPINVRLPPPDGKDGEEKSGASAQPAAADGPATPGEPRRSFETPLFDRPRGSGGAAERTPLLRREAAPAESGGAPRPGLPAFPSPNGGQRRILHLSLGTAGHGDGGGAEPPYPQHPQSVESGERAAPSRPAAARPSEAPFAGRSAAYGPATPQRGPEPHSEKETAASLDSALRQRVSGDIAAFLAAFDSALANDTVESRAVLREATDRLLRAGARTRIELERLEARFPLPPRDQGRESGSAWRQR
jgi:hypothetical protein